MRFEVGNKVKVVCFDPEGKDGVNPDKNMQKLIGEVGIISFIYPDEMHPVVVKFENIELVFGNERCFYENELVKHRVEGQQLLFSFME